MVDIRQLDLEGNLLSRWSDVALIADELTLTELRLSSNYLVDDITTPSSSSASSSSVAASTTMVPAMETTTTTRGGSNESEVKIASLPLVGLRSSFSQLRTLVLNSVPSSWCSVVSISMANALPSLEELYCCYNKIETLQLPSSSSSSSISHLQPSQTLQAAQLPTNSNSNNNVKGAPFTCFKELRVLDLSNNNISEWHDIMLLSYLPKYYYLPARSPFIFSPNHYSSFHTFPFLSFSFPLPHHSNDTSNDISKSDCGIVMCDVVMSLKRWRSTDWNDWYSMKIN
jgi:hypothetical protein